MTKQKILILASILFLIGILFFLNPQLLILPSLLLVWMIFSSQTDNDPDSKRSVHITFNKRRIFFYLTILGLLAGELTEIFAILSNLNLPLEQRILFLPDPFLDLVVSVAYYLPLSIALAWFLVKFDINWKKVFLAGGIYGILTEQTGAIFLSFNIVFWVYVASVYGSFIAMPAVILGVKLNLLERKHVNPVILVPLLVLTLVFAFLFVGRFLMALFFIVLGIPF